MLFFKLVIVKKIVYTNFLSNRIPNQFQTVNDENFTEIQDKMSCRKKISDKKS